MAKLTRPNADEIHRKARKLIAFFSFPLFRQSHPRPSPAGPSLCDLPVEILQLITSFLSTSSAASLAQSNKKVCRVIGTQYWQILKASARRQCEDEKFQFLSLLEKDYSQYFLCYRCNTLHLRDPRDLPRNGDIWLERHKLRDCEVQDGTIKLNDYLFVADYRHLQMAMKSYRNAAHFGPMSDALSYGYTQKLFATFRGSQRALVTADELLIEQQSSVQESKTSDIM